MGVRGRKWMKDWNDTGKRQRRERNQLAIQCCSWDKKKTSGQTPHINKTFKHDIQRLWTQNPSPQEIQPPTPRTWYLKRQPITPPGVWYQGTRNICYPLHSLQSIILGRIIELMSLRATEVALGIFSWDEIQFLLFTLCSNVFNSLTCTKNRLFYTLCSI